MTTQKFKMRHTKKNSKCDQINKKKMCDQTKTLNMQQNSQIQNGTKLNNSNVTKLKNSKFDKTLKLKR